MLATQVDSAAMTSPGGTPSKGAASSSPAPSPHQSPAPSASASNSQLAGQSAGRMGLSGLSPVHSIPGIPCVPSGNPGCHISHYADLDARLPDIAIATVAQGSTARAALRRSRAPTLQRPSQQLRLRRQRPRVSPNACCGFPTSMMMTMVVRATPWQTEHFGSSKSCTGCNYRN